jgi:hypothetical protein
MALSDQTWVIEPGLTIAELPAADALVAEAGWNQVAADWRVFLDFGTVHAVRTDAGQVIATAATLPYGDRICWISMVLVAGRYRRHGLATSLLRRCLDDIAAAGLTAVLDATAAGQPVYRALDFLDLWSFTRLAAPTRRQIAGRPFADEIVIRPIDDGVWPALCAYDAAAFGADRSAVLGRMRGRLPSAELFAERRGRPAGLLSAATVAPPHSSGRSSPKTMPWPRPCSHARCAASRVRSSSILRTPSRAFALGSRQTVFRPSARSCACARAGRRASMIRLARWR